MKRRVFNGLITLSLLLSALTAMFWWRSWHGCESLERVDPERRIMVTSMHGLIQATRWDGPFEETRATALEYGHAPLQTWQQWKHWPGFASATSLPRGPDDWAYQPSVGQSHWWQGVGFDGFDWQVKPQRNTVYLHDWLPSQWCGRQRSLTIPYWAVMLVVLSLPLVALARNFRLAERSRAGLCQTCGYDLRATPDRCPECGIDVRGQRRDKEELEVP